MKHLAITNERHLLSLLKIDRAELTQVISNTSIYYNPHFKKEKKKNVVKERPICPSNGKLVLLQHRLKNSVFGKYQLPQYVQGGVKGTDHVKNSKMHQGKNYHFCLDLKNCYPSIKNTRINKVLLKLGYTPNIAAIITKLTTVTLQKQIKTKDGIKTITLNREIPQGAPTSNSICNLVLYVSIDKSIETIIKGRNITYTRYIDDLNFSSQTDFSDIINEIARIVSDANFKISRSKTYYKKGKVIITGPLVGQNGIYPSTSLFEKLEEVGRSEESKKGILRHIERIKKA